MQVQALPFTGATSAATPVTDPASSRKLDALIIAYEAQRPGAGRRVLRLRKRLAERHIPRIVVGEGGQA